MNVTGGTPPEAWTEPDRQRYFVNIVEIGAPSEHPRPERRPRGPEDGFDAYRHVVTRTDGAEIVQIMAH